MDSALGKDRLVIVFGGQGILLDVEGTTSSIAFVYDVLFTFAKEHVGAFLARHGGDPLVRDIAAQLAAETGADAGDATRLALAAIDLMNRDVKSTPLKALQGLIWRGGFESGDLVAHVFDDVPPALEQWSHSGLDVRIYSSGSNEAQKLFFGHTAFGDLTPHLRGHYDTTTGPKREAASYATIAADMGLEPRQILFVSDIGAELDAARQAGMATALALRPGNREPGGLLDHEPVSSFAEIVI
jgi:enolase-phosphatase E1